LLKKNKRHAGTCRLCKSSNIKEAYSTYSHFNVCFFELSYVFFLDKDLTECVLHIVGIIFKRRTFIVRKKTRMRKYIKVKCVVVRGRLVHAKDFALPYFKVYLE